MGRVRGRPFQAGNKFGRGRPKGSRNKKTILFQSLLDDYGETLMRKCMADALQGDRHAMRLCMERLLAPRRDPVVSLPLPTLRTLVDVDVATQRLVHAIAAGEVTPTQGEAVASILENRRRVLETVDLQNRIERLEQANQQAGEQR